MGRIGTIFVMVIAAIVLVVQAGRSVNAATPQSQHWQYAEIVREAGHYTKQFTYFSGGIHSEFIKNEDEESAFGQRITKMGTDGWELVSTVGFQDTLAGITTDGLRYTFKRLTP